MLRFDFLEARNLRHAISLLERHGDEATPVAGSTDFLVRWRQSAPGRWRTSPACVVNIKGLSSLGRIAYSPQNGLRLGALATVQSVETNAQVRRRYQALATGATSFANWLLGAGAEPGHRGRLITFAMRLPLAIPCRPCWPSTPSAPSPGPAAPAPCP